jgi:phage terminase large subunit-like protein
MDKGNEITAFEQYFTGIYDGSIVACEKMKQCSEMLLNKFASPDEYHFDPEIAAKHTGFIETFCRIPSGKLGAPFKLELFQKARFQAIFGFVDDNNLRQYNEVMTMEARKNGKTSECAAIELDMLINDNEGAPQIYNIATQLTQAQLGYKAAYKMVQLSPELSRVIKKRAWDLYFPHNMGYIRALASNTNSMDGLDISCAVIDELAAIKSRDVYDLIRQAISARPQPLLFTITTNGYLRDGIFDTQYNYATQILNGTVDNKKFLPFIYELDSIDEWDKPECWIKANPGLGTIKSVDYLQEIVEKAKDDPATKPSVLVKDFNMKQTAESAWLRWEDLNNEETWEIDFDYGIGCFDAADTTDLNAAHVLYMRPDDDTIYCESMYWIPQEVIDKWEDNGQRQGRDNAPYKLWQDQGYLRTCPGNKCDKRIFLEWFKELRETKDVYIRYIGFDPWHIDDTLEREFKMEFGEQSMIRVRQGTMTLSEPMKAMKADLQAKKINYQNNPITKWCMMNTEVRTDVNGNIQPVKGLDSRKRIDGTVALICGYKVLQDKKDLYVNLN